MAILDKINPELRQKVQTLITRCVSLGVEMRVTDGLRDPFEQAKLWRQSRPKSIIEAKIAELMHNGASFLAECLRKVGPQNGEHVTNTIPGVSWHQWGEAVDCVWIVNGAAEWSEDKLINGVNGYRIYAKEAEEMGLTAGGHWVNFKDWPHVQLRSAANAASIMSIVEINNKMEERFGTTHANLLSVASAVETTAPSDLTQKIAEVVANSTIKRYFWLQRGYAPIGYIKGMAITYAKSYRELKRGEDTAAKVMSQELGSPNKDALAWYGIPGETAVDRLRSVYTLALGLGMRESSGNTTEGRDMSVPENEATEANAEAGLFQVSYDSFDVSPWMRKLYDSYRADSSKCFLTTFLEGVHQLNRAVVGTGNGAAFQKFTKECPSFATEYVMLMLRLNRTHFGPINHKKAEYKTGAEVMLRKIEDLVDQG
jgi:peptidoglycan LD-endopeptidase CwlK